MTVDDLGTAQVVDAFVAGYRRCSTRFRGPGGLTISSYDLGTPHNNATVVVLAPASAFFDSMAGLGAMKALTAASATQLIAESIRTQLGTEAVVLITPSSSGIAVVVAQASDASGRLTRDSAEPAREPASNEQHGEKLAYSVDEAARALGLSRELIYDQLRTGRLKSLKVGRRRIITREHMDKFLANR